MFLSREIDIKLCHIYTKIYIYKIMYKNSRFKEIIFRTCFCKSNKRRESADLNKKIQVPGYENPEPKKIRVPGYENPEPKKIRVPGYEKPEPQKIRVPGYENPEPQKIRVPGSENPGTLIWKSRTEENPGTRIWKSRYPDMKIQNRRKSGYPRPCWVPLIMNIWSWSPLLDFRITAWSKVSSHRRKTWFSWFKTYIRICFCFLKIISLFVSSQLPTNIQLGVSITSLGSQRCPVES